MLTAMGRIFESATAGRVKNVDTPRQFKSEKDREIYIVYRQRIEEFLHLFLLWDAMQAGGAPPPNVMGHGSEEFANTLRTATIGWLASLVDKDRSALNVFDLWLKIFPERASTSSGFAMKSSLI